jgi:hypothetical protein
MIVRCRVDKSKLHSILSTKLTDIAYTWYTRKIEEFSKCDNDYVIVIILKAFKAEYLNDMQRVQLDRAIRKLSMKSGSYISAEDIDMHYTSFMKLFNSIQMCDPTTSDSQYVQLYKDSLPISLMQLMGNIDDMKTLDSLHSGCISACNKLSLNAVSLNRD